MGFPNISHRDLVLGDLDEFARKANRDFPGGRFTFPLGMDGAGGRGGGVPPEILVLKHCIQKSWVLKPYELDRQ